MATSLGATPIATAASVDPIRPDRSGAAVAGHTPMTGSSTAILQEVPMASGTV